MPSKAGGKQQLGSIETHKEIHRARERRLCVDMEVSENMRCNASNSPRPQLWYLARVDSGR